MSTFDNTSTGFQIYTWKKKNCNEGANLQECFWLDYRAAMKEP